MTKMQLFSHQWKIVPNKCTWQCIKKLIKFWSKKDSDQKFTYFKMKPPKFSKIVSAKKALTTNSSPHTFTVNIRPKGESSHGRITSLRYSPSPMTSYQCNYVADYYATLTTTSTCYDHIASISHYYSTTNYFATSITNKHLWYHQDIKW